MSRRWTLWRTAALALKTALFVCVIAGCRYPKQNPSYLVAQKVKHTYGCKDTKVENPAYGQFIARGCGLTKYFDYKCHGPPRKRKCH